MKIAITSTGTEFDSAVEPRFGRCAYFALVDNEAQTALIRQECQKDGVPVVGLIPFEPAVSRALVARQTVVDFACGPATDAVVATWEQVQRTLAGQAP
jgi:MinD superfamily P-loop ATPase